jgi:hypothetical protein
MVLWLWASLSFQGILGFEKGVNVADMLPLLSYNYSEEEGEEQIERPLWLWLLMDVILYINLTKKQMKLIQILT